MYELGTIFLFSIYSFLQAIQDGVDYVLIVVTIMLHLLMFIIIRMKYIGNDNRLDLIYYIYLCIMSFYVHPSFMIIAFSVIIVKRGFNTRNSIVTCSISLLSYHTYYNELSNMIVWMHMSILFGGFYWSKLMDIISNLQEQIDKTRDKSKSYENKLKELHIYNEQIEYTTKLAERNQIAQRIHDQFGHTLAGNIMRLEVVKILIEQNPEKAKVTLEDIINDLRQGMDEIRAILRALKPASSEMGIHTIKEMLGELDADTSFKTNLCYEGSLNAISFIRWKVIVDNLVEAMTNLKKYSNASEFSVGIYQYNQVLKVEFKDNGRVEQAFEKGLGIRGMEERVIETGGTIRYNLENGFCITMLWVDRNDKNLNRR